MSTNAVVAVGDLKNWKGVVDYWDGCPTGTGQDLCNSLGERFGGSKFSAEAFAAELRRFGNDVLKAKRWEVFRGREADGRSVPIVTSDNPDPLQNQWVYIINPDKRVIHVLANLSCKWVAPPKGSRVSLNAGVLWNGPVQISGGRWHYGHVVEKHYHVADIDITAEPPDFEAIQAQHNETYEQLAPKNPWGVFGFFDSRFSKQLVKQAGEQFKANAARLRLNPNYLGKVIKVNGKEQKILGLTRGYKNRWEVLAHTSGMKVYDAINLKEVQQALK